MKFSKTADAFKVLIIIGLVALIGHQGFGHSAILDAMPPGGKKKKAVAAHADGHYKAAAAPSSASSSTARTGPKRSREAARRTSRLASMQRTPASARGSELLAAGSSSSSADASKRQATKNLDNNNKRIRRTSSQVRRDQAQIDAHKARFNYYKNKGDIRPGTYQQGFPGRTETVRGKRSYKDQRELQILRQFSTQLFFAASETTQPVEVEAMYAEGKVFIAANNNAAIDKIKEVLNQNTKKVLTSTYTSEKASQRSAVRETTGRFARKFTTWYSGDRDIPEAQPIFDAINTDDALGEIDLDDPEVSNVFSGNEKIFLVYGKDREEGVHAEEKLMDVVRELKDKDREYFVAGMKRPCTSCSGRLNYEAGVGDYNVHYLKRPGRTYYGKAVRQSPEVFKETEELWKLAETFRSRLGTGFGSESDSDLDSSDDEDESDSDEENDDDDDDESEEGF